jgi:hypothetical protein
MIYGIMFMLWLIISTVCLTLVIVGPLSENKIKRYITYFFAATNPISWIMAIAIGIYYMLSD